MSRMLFVNIAVNDLAASVAFYGKLGFEFDPQFTDEHASRMIVNDETSFMLLDRGRFADFTTKEIADSRTQVEALFAFSATSREEVDELVATAISAGGSPAGEKQDHGFMYGWSFQDIDGHTIEVMWMDPSGMPQE